MLSLFIFFSVYFTVPGNNISEFHKTTCENQSQYFLYNGYNYMGDNSHADIIDSESNSIFSGTLSNRDFFKIEKFYCIDNEIYILLTESRDGGTILDEFNIYKLVDDTLVQQDSIEYVYGYNLVIFENNLIYNKYNDKYFYKTEYAKVFGDTQELFHSPNYSYTQNTFYFDETESILFIDKINQNAHLQNIDNIIDYIYIKATNLYDVVKYGDKMYFLTEDENQKIIIIDEEGIKYYEYELLNGEDVETGVLRINEYGIYALVLFDNKDLKVISSPNFDQNKSMMKDVQTNVAKLYKDNGEIFYLKNNSNNTTVNLINGECTKPDSPLLGDEITGVHSNKPSSFTISNFNEDNICFVSYQFDVSGNERFTSAYYGETVSYYNQNSSFQTYQFYNNFVFEDNKPYYIRIKYDNILTSSDYTYVRLIIADLGEITSFEILDVSSNSTMFTNNEMVNINLEKLGSIDQIQLYTDESFKNQTGDDISAINFNYEFNFLLPSEEKEHIYYLRPVIIDPDNNNIMGGNTAKIARITLDKTAPSKPEITTINETFLQENIAIKWNLSQDNLSGIANYKIRLVDSLSNEVELLTLENTVKDYSPSVFLEKGTYTFFISSCDNAENCSEESKTNFIVEEKENLKPYKPSLVRPKNKDVIDAMPVNISWSKSDDPEGDEVTYSLIIAKDSEFSQIEFEGNLISNLSTEITYLSQGRYYLKLYAVDSHGNNSDNELIEFDVIEPNNKTNSSSGCSF